MAKSSRQGAANRLYGKTKVGIVGKRPTTLPAAPTRQPNHGADHTVIDDVAQRPWPYSVRSEGGTLSAAGTDGPVADPIRRIPAHAGVVLLDLSF